MCYIPGKKLWSQDHTQTVSWLAIKCLWPNSSCLEELERSRMCTPCDGELWNIMLTLGFVLFRRVEGICGRCYEMQKNDYPSVANIVPK